MKKNLKNNPYVLFSYFFVFWFGYELLTTYKEGINWGGSLFGAFFYAALMTFTFKSILGEQNPFYLKLSEYDQVLEVLKEIGTTKIKEKNEKTYYRINGKKWINSKIVVKKTPFYLYVECPDDYKEKFIGFMSSNA